MAYGDSFVDTAGTALESHTPTGTGGAGGTWTRVDGVASNGQINASNQLKSTSGTNTAYTFPIGVSDTVASVGYTVRDEPSGATDFSFKCCTRLSDSNNFVGVRNNSTHYQVFKRVTGTFTQLGSTSTATAANGDVILLTDDSTNVALTINGSTASGVGGSDTFNNTQKSCGIVIRQINDPMLDDFVVNLAGGGGTSGDFFQTMMGIG